MNFPDTMRAIEIRAPGDADQLILTSRPVPRPVDGEVLIRVAAAGINRADVMQRLGLYPPPPGVTDIPGLEVAGEIVEVGEGVSSFAVGDKVCALLPGGGYAEYATAPAGQVLSIPQGMSLEEAAGLPETLFTCWMVLVRDGGLKAGETLLLHGGSSGIGTTGIRLAKLLGATVIVTAGSDEKCSVCRELGADLAINYRTQDFVTEIKQAGLAPRLVVDMVGGDYLPRNMEVMAPKGKHINIGLMGGMTTEIPLATLVLKQLTLTASTLRGESPEAKSALARDIVAHLGEALAQGKLTPRIHARFPLADAAAAHRLMEESSHIGKIVLTM